MGLDGLGSAAYGPEAALTVLAPLGAAGLGDGADHGVILALLAVLFLSYWQTIAAYPTNGGSYTVARENLGTSAGLLAAAALMVDYMLNVAVGISAGIGGADLGGAGAAALHPAAVPGVLVAGHAGEPARHARSRAGAGGADLPVHRQPGRGARRRHLAGLVVGHPAPVVPPPRHRPRRRRR